jgi:hypothetical protein
MITGNCDCELSRSLRLHSEDPAACGQKESRFWHACNVNCQLYGRAFWNQKITRKQNAARAYIL